MAAIPMKRNLQRMQNILEQLRDAEHEVQQQRDVDAAMSMTLAEATRMLKAAEESAERIIQIEKDLLNAHKLLDGLINNAPSAVIIVDSQGIITHWNASAYHLYGWAPDECIGQSIEKIIPERYQGLHATAFRDLVDGKSSRGLLYKNVLVPACHKNGEEIKVIFMVVPVRASDSFRFISFSRPLNAPQYDVALEKGP